VQSNDQYDTIKKTGFMMKSPLVAETISKSSDSDILSLLLSFDLDFKGLNKYNAIHNFHSFAAKFPPQLPRLFIEYLTKPGEVVLDPMMGSGTTIVETILTGRRAIGFDIDPLAVEIALVKTTRLQKTRILEAYTELFNNIRYVLGNSPEVEEALEKRFDEGTRKFIDYWFHPHIQKELMTIVLAIERIEDTDIQRFFKLVFSSIIITKSGGVSRARDLAHSRPHLVKSKIPQNVMEAFSSRVKKTCSGLNDFGQNASEPYIRQCDARQLPLPDSSVDLVVTSPPYANAIDYMRAHKFSLVWFGQSVAGLTELRSKYIGTERANDSSPTGLPALARSTIERVSELDKARGRILTKYFQEMKIVLKEVHRVLKKNKNAVIVIGSSTMRGVETQTHLNLVEIAEGVGFQIIGIAKRLIDRDKRMMPARNHSDGSSQIEMRMHEEYVIGLRKTK
jgi:DNA modification methylase